MSYKPNDPYYKEFTTANPSTGAAANADGLPVATANHNGTDDAAFVLTVTNLDAGRYKVTGTIPSGYAAGDVLNVSVAATCSSVAGKAVVDTQVLGGVAQTGDSFARLGAAGAGLTALGDARVAHLDADVSSRLAAGNVTVGGYAAGQDPFTLVGAGTVEGSFTFLQSCRMWNASLGGKVDGRGGTTIHVRDLGDAKNRFTLTLDGSGNVTAVTRDLT